MKQHEDLVAPHTWGFGWLLGILQSYARTYQLANTAPHAQPNSAKASLQCKFQISNLATWQFSTASDKFWQGMQQSATGLATICAHLCVLLNTELAL
jgi:hypothetical protein